MSHRDRRWTQSHLGLGMSRRNARLRILHLLSLMGSREGPNGHNNNLVPQERTGYQNSSASPFTGQGDPRKQQEKAGKWVGEDQTANQDAFKQAPGLEPTIYLAHTTLGDRVENVFHLAQLRHQGNNIFISHLLSEGYFWAVLHSGDQKKSSIITGAGYWESGRI